MSMSNLLRFNFRKLKKQKSFYILLGIMLGVLFLNAATYKMTIDMIENSNRDIPLFGMQLPNGFIDFGLTSIDNSSFVTLIGIIIALAVCDDYEQHTIRTIFARGYTRIQAYFSKLTAMFAAVTVAFAIIMPCGFAIGLSFFGSKDADLGKVAALIGIQYFTALGSAAFMFMLSTLIKRSGLSIAMAIIAPTVINLILVLLDLGLKNEETKIADFWITSCFASMANTNVSGKNMLFCLVISIAYTVAFVAVGAAIAKKAEV